MLDSPMFFLATAKPDESRVFYKQTLGLRFVEEDDWALVFEFSGTALRIQKVEEVPAVNHTVLGWLVSDIESAVANLRARGVAFERYPQLSQNGDGVWSSPSGARIAWFHDPDGNTLSLTQARGSALAGP